MDGGGGAAREFGEGFSSLQGTTGNSQLVQLSGTGYDGEGRRLVGGGGQPKKRSEELDADDKYNGPGGGRPKDVQFF